MKLHVTAVNKLIELFHLHGGSADEARLKKFISNLDFTPYGRQTTPDQEVILVLTEDYTKQLNSRG